MQIDLSGKVALVTGSTRGIGRAIAETLAECGARVAVVGRDLARAEEAASALGGEARGFACDVSDVASVARLVEEVEKGFGSLDILVNNAGISGTFDPDMLSTSAWDSLMNVNAKGVFLGMKYAIPVMQKAGGGAIVNISSISGFVGQTGVHMGYNASKGAVRIMTKTAAVQFAKDGIRVNSVHPGFLPPMRTSKTSADPEWRAKMLKAVPMKREGRVEEVAHAVLFLASDEASYITGTELVVDGGYLAV